MQSEQVFFQLAATLIPVFLFVGAVSQRLHPGPWMTRRWGTAFAFVLVLAITVIPIIAEASALTAALGNDASAFDRWLVAGTLCLATIAACLAVIWPLLGSLDRRLGGSFRIVVAVMALVLAASSAHLLNSGIQAAARSDRFDEMNEALTHMTGRVGVQLRRAHDEETVEDALATMGIDNKALVKTLVEPSPLGRIRRAVGRVPGGPGRFVRRMWAKEELSGALRDFGVDDKGARRIAREVVTARPGQDLWGLVKASELFAIAHSLGVQRQDLQAFLSRYVRELSPGG